MMQNMNDKQFLIHVEFQLVKLFLGCIYRHFTGSCCWQFNSPVFDQLCRSWNVNLRVMFNLDYAMHTWIVEDTLDS